MTDYDPRLTPGQIAEIERFGEHVRGTAAVAEVQRLIAADDEQKAQARALPDACRARVGCCDGTRWTVEDMEFRPGHPVTEEQRARFAAMGVRLLGPDEALTGESPPMRGVRPGLSSEAEVDLPVKLLSGGRIVSLFRGPKMPEMTRAERWLRERAERKDEG